MLTFEYVYKHNVCHYAFYDVLNTFQGCTVDVHTYAHNCRQTLLHLVNIQTLSLHQCAPHHVSNVHDKFQSCTVGVHTAMMFFKNPKAYLGGCVQCMFTPTHLIADNHYPILLWVYKPSLCTSMLLTMLAM